MSRRILFLFALGLAACSSTSSDGAVVDGGTDGTIDSIDSLDSNESGFDAPSDACTDCIGAQLSWGSNGGLVAYEDTSALAPCRTYTYTRVHHDADVGGPRSCTTDVAVCGATDVVGLTQVEGALAQPDVVAALASAPVLYGRDTRPVDGSVFQITYDGRTISVGLDCDGTSPCTPVPAGIKALETVLQNLDIQELSKDPCVAVFGHPGGA